MKIAVLGPKGTFSDKAYLEYEKKHRDLKFEPEYYPTIGYCASGEYLGWICSKNLGFAFREGTSGCG